MNLDTDPARLAQNAFLDADNPDLTAFHGSGSVEDAQSFSCRKD